MITLVKREQATNIILAAQVSGNLNGTNRVFNTHSDFKSGKVSLLCNGQVLHSPEDFRETGPNEITLVHFAPEFDYILRVTYEEV